MRNNFTEGNSNNDFLAYYVADKIFGFYNKKNTYMDGEEINYAN